MYLVINKCVTAVKFSNFSGHYLRNRSTLGIGVLGYIGIVQHKEHSPKVLSIPPGTPCIFTYLLLKQNLTFRGPCIVIRSYNKSQQDALFLYFILVKNSTRFGQIYCPSSGVLILYSQQLVFVMLLMLTVCYLFHPDIASRQST